MIKVDYQILFVIVYKFLHLTGLKKAPRGKINEKISTSWAVYFII